MVYILHGAGGGNPARFACPFLGLQGVNFGFCALPMSKNSPGPNRGLYGPILAKHKKGACNSPRIGI